MSRTLSGLFLVGALNRPRKRKRTNRENPRTIPKQIGKIPEKSGKDKKGQKRTKKDRKGQKRTKKDKKGQKRTKKEGQVQNGKPPRLKPPRLAALEKNIFRANFLLRKSGSNKCFVAQRICRRLSCLLLALKDPTGSFFVEHVPHRNVRESSDTAQNQIWQLTVKQRLDCIINSNDFFSMNEV